MPYPNLKKPNKFKDYRECSYINCKVIQRIPPPENRHLSPTYWEVKCCCGKNMIHTSNTLKKHLGKKGPHCGCLTNREEELILNQIIESVVPFLEGLERLKKFYSKRKYKKPMVI